MIKKITIQTRSSVEYIDITHEVSTVIGESGVKEGICFLFVPHTTAAVTINENADPSVISDLMKEINKIIPFNDNYRHLEGNAAAHIKASLIGSSEIIPVVDGNLLFGTWQGLFFCEFDGPRTRNLYIDVIKT